jgi:TPP-dependent pyruvate/acetoin dehydrogenase alpha subunit
LIGWTRVRRRLLGWEAMSAAKAVAAALAAPEAFTPMLSIRSEELVLRLRKAGEIAGSVHTCLGQEAVPVGACNAVVR